MKRIAVIITCFNRRSKTLSCLSTLYKALDQYNDSHKVQISLSIYLTDDGCTDGTQEAVLNEFNDRDINIIKGNGNLYWAGGMRKAWKAAIDTKNNWDYFLLLNDDTDLLPNLFEELFDSCDYSMQHYGKVGIVSGVTSAKSDNSKITYGGDVWVNRWTARQKRVIPQGEPVLVDLTNANILLVHNSVVKMMGIFYKGFRHGNADYDYSNHARKNGFPVLITGNVCGRCDNDHGSFDEYKEKIISMSLSQRRKYFSNPLKSTSDYLCFIRRNAILRYPLVVAGNFLNLYFPSFYYKLYDKR